MKNYIRKIVAATCLLGLVALPTTIAFAQATPASDASSPTPKKGKEAHPQIQKAIKDLETARQHLEEAAHDFGGHKADAMKACDEAIKQLREALKFDKS